MKVFRLLLLCSLSLLLCLPTFAQAPTTAKIAFVSRGINPPGIYQSNIYMMNPDGSDLVNLISKSRSRGINHIAWEPSGQRMLFCSDHKGKHDIHIMNADGTDAKPMFTEPRYRVEPTWSPDGNQVAYIAHEMLNSEAIWFDPAVTVSVEPSAFSLITTWGTVKNQN